MPKTDHTYILNANVAIEYQQSWHQSCCCHDGPLKTKTLNVPFYTLNNSFYLKQYSIQDYSGIYYPVKRTHDLLGNLWFPKYQ